MRKFLIISSLAIIILGCSPKNVCNSGFNSKEISANFNEINIQKIFDFVCNVDSLFAEYYYDSVKQYDSLIYWLYNTSNEYNYDKPFHGRTIYNFKDQCNSLVDSNIFKLFWEYNTVRIRINDSTYTYKVWDIKRNSNYSQFIQEWSKNETMFSGYINQLNESGAIPLAPDDLIHFSELNLNNINNRLIFQIHCFTFLNGFLPYDLYVLD